MKRLLSLPLCLLLSLGLTLGASPAVADDPPLPGLPALPTVPGLPIPSLPTDLLVPDHEGAPATPRPVAHPPIPQNPHLAPNGSNSMHNDPYSSDAYRQGGPLGDDLTVRSASYGVRECATVTFDSRGRIEALCGGLEGFTMMLIDPDTLQPLAELPMPARTGLSNPFTDLCGGTYFFLDEQDRAFALTTESEVREVRQAPGPKLVRGRTWQIAPHLPEDDCLVALTVDWSGLIWFFSQDGTVGTLDRSTGEVRTRRLGQARGEGIYNSVSVDETGGVYVVTTHATYRLDAGRSGRPAVTWRRSYDRGTATKPGMLSQGSGTSPTLIGKRWIAVADNADPMNVLIHDRRRGTSGRLHCSVPVFHKGASATENSLVAAGSSVLVENNHGYAGVQSTLLGRTSTPGFARVVIDRQGCHKAWQNDTVVAPTSVPKASLANGLVYAYTKPARDDLVDAWYLSAIDIRTGKVRWSQLTGTGTQWNNHYASVYLGPDGRLFIATVAGLVRLADGHGPASTGRLSRPGLE